ncbi:hypothetical protein [Leifsonia xyli]|uniref:hypothetical protein n=1 Tax=Leifsonia xyli TaxID=1575 RepID=UPI00114CEFCC|nr:hypothetical protein [Leifsonia xyli]
MRADVQDTFTHQFGMVVDRDFYMTPRVAIAKQHGLFDVATVGGRLALANVWAFNVMSLDTLQRDVYSWNFIVSRVREDGAEVSFGTRTRQIARSDVPIRVIIDPPQVNSGQRGEIYEAALEQWERSKVEIRTLKEFRQEPDQLLPAR